MYRTLKTKHHKNFSYSLGRNPRSLFVHNDRVPKSSSVRGWIRVTLLWANEGVRVRLSSTTSLFIVLSGRLSFGAPVVPRPSLPDRRRGSGRFARGLFRHPSGGRSLRIEDRPPSSRRTYRVTVSYEVERGAITRQWSHPLN